MNSSSNDAGPPVAQTRDAVLDCAVLAVASLITYLIATQLLSRVGSASKNDDLLGGMWAVIATIFVIRNGYGQSRAAAVSRLAATSISFTPCFIYLLCPPFHSWAPAVLIALMCCADQAVCVSSTIRLIRRSA